MEVVLFPFKKNIFTLTAAEYLTIPPVSFVEHKVKLSDNEQSNYNQLAAMLSVEIGGEILSVNESAKFAKLQTLCNGFIYDTVTSEAKRGATSTKLVEVAEFCTRAAAEGDPVLLFYAFREEAIWLAEMLTANGLRVCSPSNKNFLSMWNNGEVDVLMAHPASAGHGLNLQHGGRLVVWSSITYNFEFWEQANARLARQGQTKPVQIHVFQTVGTVESRQFTAISNKKQDNEIFKYLTKC